jgi:hypothetical protein
MESERIVYKNVSEHETVKSADNYTGLCMNLLFKPVVFNLFSPRTPRDTSPLNFVPPKLLVQDFIVE